MEKFGAKANPRNDKALKKFENIRLGLLPYVFAIHPMNRLEITALIIIDVPSRLFFQAFVQYNPNSLVMVFGEFFSSMVMGFY